MSFYSTTIAPSAPWTDRNGDVSALRLVTFVLLMAPGTAIFAELFFGAVRPEPYEHALHETGEWTVRFLLASLAITPIRRIFRWNRVIGIRRMIGVASLVYALLHLGLYMAQENWIMSKVVSEIAFRFYLTIGFIALLGLLALGATSFDRAVRKLGKRWNQLHKLTFPIAFLALWHYFLQSKADVFTATLMSGIFLLLVTYRLTAWRRLPLDNLVVLTGLALVAAAFTAGVEFAWYSLATNFPADRVFMANFNLDAPWRPAIWTAVIGFGVAVIFGLVRLASWLKSKPPLAPQ